MSTPHKPHKPGFLAIVNDAKSRVKQVDIDQYQKMARESHTLIDVREDNEFAAGHVQGAVHLSRGTIERDIEKQYPDRSTPMVLYCGGGFRSALVAESLQKMGYTNVISVDGGFKALKDLGAEIVTGD